MLGVVLARIVHDAGAKRRVSYSRALGCEWGAQKGGHARSLRTFHTSAIRKHTPMVVSQSERERQRECPPSDCGLRQQSAALWPTHLPTAAGSEKPRGAAAVCLGCGAAIVRATYGKVGS